MEGQKPLRTRGRPPSRRTCEASFKPDVDVNKCFVEFNFFFNFTCANGILMNPLIKIKDLKKC